MRITYNWTHEDGGSVLVDRVKLTAENIGNYDLNQFHASPIADVYRRNPKSPYIVNIKDVRFYHDSVTKSHCLKVDWFEDRLIDLITKINMAERL